MLKPRKNVFGEKTFFKYQNSFSQKAKQKKEKMFWNEITSVVFQQIKESVETPER